RYHDRADGSRPPQMGAGEVARTIPRPARREHSAAAARHRGRSRPDDILSRLPALVLRHGTVHRNRRRRLTQHLKETHMAATQQAIRVLYRTGVNGEAVIAG